MGLVLGRMLGGHDLIVRVSWLIACKVLEFIFGVGRERLPVRSLGSIPGHPSGNRDWNEPQFPP